MKRTANAVWTGSIKEGIGSLTAPGGVLHDTKYSVASRFADGPGTNPEELIAAAHAGCFSMALAGQLAAANLIPETIRTTATLNMDKDDSGWTINTIHLDVTAKIPGATPEQFQTAAQNAEVGCPVSKVLKGAKITMTAVLEA